MASTIKLKNGSGAPLAGDLVQGEPALDLTNKRLYTEDSGGTVIEVGINPSSLTTSSADINGGTVDGTVIGGSSAAAGSFTTLTASGEITANGGIALGDNEKATFGASDDLQIYHSGTNSYIQDLGAGDLYIQGSSTVLLGSASQTNMVLADGGAVTLRYNGSNKLATTATGIDVTGTITADGLTVDGATSLGGTSVNQLNISGLTKITGVRGTFVDPSEDPSIPNIFATNDAVGDFSQEAGHLVIQPRVHPTVFRDVIFAGGAGTTKRLMTIQGEGDISFYDDTGTTAKFYWDASAESLGIGTSSVDSLLHLSKASGGSVIRLENPDIGLSDTEVVGKIEFETQDTGGAGVNSYIQAVGQGTGGANKLEFGTGTANSPSTRMVIDSIGNVGIGTTSPSSALDVIGDIEVSGAVNLGDTYGVQWGTGNERIVGVNTGNSLRFVTNNTEAMRIDSSGNLLVGTTSQYGSTGITLQQDGLVYARRTGVPSYLRRDGSDGDIIYMEKDGTAVGSIGVKYSDDPYFASSAEDIGISLGGSALYPSGSAGTTKDNFVNLGSSGVRFKDLYLSGGVYLGGTGAANHLDDYEEGTFTASLRGSTAEPATLITTTARYTKVGNTVFIAVSFENINTTGYSGQITVTGVPFASNNSTRTQFSVGHYQTTTWNTGEVPVAQLGTSSTTVIFQNTVSGGVWAGNTHNAGTARFMWVTGAYIAA